jgi:hypothetical protein
MTTMSSLEDQMALIGAQLRSLTMDPATAKASALGEEAKRSHEAKRVALQRELEELAAAQRQQVGLDTYLKRKAEKEAEAAATAAAQAALAEETTQRLDAFDDIVANLKRAAAGVVRVLARNAAQSKLACGAHQWARSGHSLADAASC